MNRIATVVKGYPRLSETFIAQEILGLEKRGIRQLIVSLRKPTESKVHDLNREIAAEVLYLPEYLRDDPERVRLARRWAEARPGFAAAWAAFQADLARDRTVNRWRRWGQACVLARELPDDVDWLHTHFLHTPASVTRYAALIRGLGWSFSAHAKDIWTTPEWELAEKLADAEWGVTCTRANLDYLRSLARNPGKVHLVYHGLDFSRFPAPPERPAKQTGPITIASVGRAVEKKGYDDLLLALASFRSPARAKSLRMNSPHTHSRHSRARGARPENPGIEQGIRGPGSSGLRYAPPEDDRSGERRGDPRTAAERNPGSTGPEFRSAPCGLRDWRFEHAGGGPLAGRLKQKAEKLGLADRVAWHGSQSRDFVFDLLARADLFVLPSRLTASGDRDGLPNVLMEAQAFGVPVLSTDVSGIPELVTHGENGFLVPQKDPRALADALRLLIEDAGLRRRLGRAGAKNVRERFSAEPGIDFVAQKLGAGRARRAAA